MITAAPTADQASAPDGRVPTMRRFQRELAIGDAVVIVIAVVASHLLRFGLTDPELSAGHGVAQLNYLPVGVVLGVVWWCLLASLHTYRERLLGSGTDEYERVIEATLTLFGLVAIGSFIFRVAVSRQYFLMMLPIGLVGLLVWRWLSRKLLIRQRRRGRYCHRAVIVGSEASTSVMMEELGRRPEMGIEFVAACLSGGDNAGKVVPGTSVPVVGGVGDVVQAVSDHAADTLVVTAAHDLTPKKIRRIGWKLDPHTQVILAPSIIDVAGPRMHLRPVEGLSLVEVEMPRFDGGKLATKRLADILISLVLLILLLPMWILIAVLIKLDDGGPVFFLQNRVGLGGGEFQMFKFRSMRTDAEDVLARIRAEAAQDAGNDVLFKMKDDPRVTRVGRVLRKLSLDELPQLVNVLRGDMSLVGPRPPLPREVQGYEAEVMRKFLVKPGITGLWQVSGRSSLSWEQSVRLDLYYVENWSLTADFQILVRTVKAVLSRSGAY